jgi:hypothetical protein
VRLHTAHIRTIYRQGCIESVKEESNPARENSRSQEVAMEREKLLEELDNLYKELDRLHKAREDNAQKVRINKEIRRILNELLEELADA